MSSFTSSEPYPQAYVPRLLAQTWERYQAGEAPKATGPDGFPIYGDLPYAAEHELLSDFIRDTETQLYNEVDMRDSKAGKAILSLDNHGKVRLTLAAAERVPWFWKTGVTKKTGSYGRGWYYDDPVSRLNLAPLLTAVLRGNVPFSASEMDAILNAALEPPDAELLFFIPAKIIVRQVQANWASTPLPEVVLAGLKRLHEYLKKTTGGLAEQRKILEELGTLIGKPRPKLIEPGEAWSEAAIAEMGKMAEGEQEAWRDLLAHCATASASSPAKKWLRRADELVNQIGKAQFSTRVRAWFALVALPRPIHQVARHPDTADPDMLIGERNAVLLKGLAWSCAGLKDVEISNALSELAEVCFKKVRWLGPRCPKVGNACLFSLSVTETDAAAAQLSRLDQRVKQRTAHKRIGKSIEKAAALTGQTREDLEETSVPTYGLDPRGSLRQAFGEFTAEFQIIGPDATALAWRNAAGKTQKAVPASVKEQHANELKAFKRTLNDITKMLPAQRTRLERLLTCERDWSLEQWRKRYLEHPLLAELVRRLIWQFAGGGRSAAGIQHEGQMVDVQGRPLDWLTPETRVRLWHPIGVEPAAVGGWRRWLEEHQVVQPFKQAHREIYVVTDAELATETYSNRFAAHILKQQQFAALANQRCWEYALMGSFDFQSTPTLMLPHWGLRVEFWVAPILERSSNTGVSRYITTDQVRFYSTGAAPLPLTEVPALVFSEVMRDVDLFVGVASVGNDPGWQDQGIDGGNTYWQEYSFGNLSASAVTRRELLERLLPKLKIASRSELADRFLKVRGQLRTYKIHLGSGNILMEPNDQYLCIVPDLSASTRSQVWLPFEGDNMLGVILSKAFLLAEDSRILDPTILSQIKIQR
jgi:Domain of unknown function (DUF4132)